MEAGQWNANNQAFRNFCLIQITTDPFPTEDPEEGVKNRLLLLSNQLAKNLVPAFCMKKSPEYSPEQVNQPVIICFDILMKYENFDLPSWSKAVKWEPTINSSISFNFLNDFQKALNLYMAYKCLKNNPIYFWSFLYLEMDDSPEGDFITQSIPIFSNDSIIVRRFATTNLHSYLTRNSQLQPNTLILLPPYDHPFYVESCSGGKASLLSIDRKRLSITNQNLTFVTLTKKPKSLFRFAPFQRPDAEAASLQGSMQKNMDRLSAKSETKSHQFAPTRSSFSKMNFQSSFFGDIEEEIEDFYTKYFCDEIKGKRPKSAYAQPMHKETKQTEYNQQETNDNDSKDIITFGLISPLELMYEMVSDKEERKILKKILIQNPIFPENSINLRLSPLPFISTLSTDIGYPSPPKTHSSFYHTTHITGQHTGIPDCIVNCRGNSLKISANNVLKSWQENAFSPINGSKSTYFRVYVINDNAHKAQLFFKELCHIYTALGLGILTPLQEYCYISINEAEIETDIKKRYQNTQFRDHQPVVFIVHPFLFDLDIDAQVISIFVPNIVIGDHKIDDIRNLAFTVYTKLRELAPAPFGKLVLGPDESSSLFFGFRFTSPITIAPNGIDNQEAIKLQIAWEPETGLSAWSDSAENCLHMSKRMDIQTLRQTIIDVRSQMTSLNVSLVIAVVAEGLDEDQYNEFMQEEFADISDFTLVSVFPSPALQADFHQPFDDDIVVMAPNERSFDSPPKGYLRPLSSCFVIPHHLPAYQVSVFSHQKDDDQTALYEVSQDFSYMSWASACFSPDKRTSALPIHIRSLLRKSRKPTLSVSRLEFLPPRFV